MKTTTIVQVRGEDLQERMVVRVNTAKKGDPTTQSTWLRIGGVVHGNDTDIDELFAMPGVWPFVNRDPLGRELHSEEVAFYVEHPEHGDGGWEWHVHISSRYQLWDVQVVDEDPAEGAGGFVTTTSDMLTTSTGLGAELRVWEPNVHENDLGRMYVLEALGASAVIREREDGTYVHIEDEGVIRKPLLVEVNNGGEQDYGTD